MTVHQILRIEGRHGEGPFISGYFPPDALWEHWAKFASLPCPSQDGISMYEYGGLWHFGFRDMAQLRKFVTPKLSGHMLAYGFTIHKVYAMRVQYGDNQVIFDRESVVTL